MEGGSLLSKGAYGCVFSPSLDCNGKEGVKSLISKIQVNDLTARNEILIGQKLKRIPNFKKYFSPVIESCPINVGQIKTEGVDDCTIITKNEAAKFVNMKIPFVKGMPLITYMSENKNNSLIFSSFTNSYIYLLNAIKLLIEQQIVHFDLKGLNIVYNTDNNHPILIDFGQSIPVDIVRTKKNYYDYFYVYAPDYYIWAPEIHLINYLIHVNNEPSNEDLVEIVDEIIKYIPVSKWLSPEFLKNYQKELLKTFKMFINKREALIEKLFLFNKTWDNYSLSILYLRFITILFSPNNELNHNTFLINLTEVLLQNIHPDPSKRMTVDQTLQRINKSSMNIDSTMNDMEELIETIKTNKKMFKRECKNIDRK